MERKEEEDSPPWFLVFQLCERKRWWWMTADQSMMDGQTLLSPREQSSILSSVSISTEILLCVRLCSRHRDTVLKRSLSSWTLSLRRSLSTSALLMFGAGPFFAAGSCPGHHGVSGNILGLYLPDTSSPLASPVVPDNQKCLQTVPSVLTGVAVRLGQTSHPSDNWCNRKAKQELK